jgi:hypothetical protein
MAVLAGVYVAVGPSPRVPLGVLTATANGDGYTVDGEVSRDAVASASATQLDSHRSVVASSAIVHSGGARLFDRTVAVYNLDDDLLMKRVGLAVFERLRDSGRFRQVRYLPAGKRLPDGERLPEIFVTLEKLRWQESGLPGSRRYAGEIVVTASDRYRRSNHSYSSTLTPPKLRYRWRAGIDYTATQTGIETSGARYQAVSRDLAAAIADRLTKLLDEMASDYGRAGAIPDPFYPDYVAPPEFNFLKKFGADKRIDGNRFMASTVAVWKIRGNHSRETVVASARESLSEAGWRVSSRDQRDLYLRATKGRQVLITFREQTTSRHAGLEDETPSAVFVAYLRNMTLAEVDSAVASLLEDGADESTLVMFQKFWHRHPDRIEDYFREHRPTYPESWRRLAELRKKSDPEAAKEALLKANALRRILCRSSSATPLKKLAEELGIESLPQTVSPEMITHLGLSRLTQPGEVEISVRRNEPSAIWLGDDGEEQIWLVLTPIPKPGSKSGSGLRIQRLRLRPGGHSVSERTVGVPRPADSPLHVVRLGERARAEVYCRAVDDGGGWRLVVRRSDD